MIRRWMIRGLAVALLTLCVGAWVGSYCESVEIEYIEHSGFNADTVVLSEGRLILRREWISPSFPKPPGFSPVRHGDNVTQWSRYFGGGYWGILGFGIRYASNPKWLMVPFWFLTLLCLLLLWWAVRKTTPKALPARVAFPVEPAAKSGETKT